MLCLLSPDPIYSIPASRKNYNGLAVVILVDFHHVQKIHERGEVLLLLRGFLQDKGNQGGVEELLALLPELVPGFSVVE